MTAPLDPIEKLTRYLGSLYARKSAAERKLAFCVVPFKRRDIEGQILYLNMEIEKTLQDMEESA